MGNVVYMVREWYAWDNDDVKFIKSLVEPPTDLRYKCVLFETFARKPVFKHAIEVYTYVWWSWIRTYHLDRRYAVVATAELMLLEYRGEPADIDVAICIDIQSAIARSVIGPSEPIYHITIGFLTTRREDIQKWVTDVRRFARYMFSLHNTDS